ncbi:MAG: Ig-like domain-containing protein [archaeon]
MKKLLIPIFLMLVLVGIVSAALDIGTIGDQTVDENETLAFTINPTYTGNGTLTFDMDPSTHGTLTKIDSLTADYEWTPGFSDAGVYVVTFLVTDGVETDSENVTITVSNVNRAPTITGKPLTIASDKDSVTHTIVASDPDGNTLTYSLLEENASKADCSLSSNQLTAKRVGDWTGTANCKVQVSDGTATAQADFAIKVERKSMLDIKKLKVFLNEGSDDESDETLSDGERFDAEVGDDISFEITIDNLFDDDNGDLDMENILVTINIENFDEDADDVEEESDEFDLRPGRDKTVTLNFGKVDKELDGVYDISIIVEGEDEDGGDHKVEWNVEMEVDRPSHKITLDNVDYPESLSCNQKSFEVKVRLENTGKNDEDEVVLLVESDDFDFFERVLNLNIDEDDTLTRTFQIDVPSNMDPGTYLVDVTAYLDADDYDSEDASDFEGFLIRMPECGSTSTPDDDDQPDDDQQTPDDGFQVITGGVTGTGGSFLGEAEEEKGFFEGPLGVALMILFIILVVVIIVVLLVKAFK